MITLPPRPQGHPIWNSRLFEWGMLVVLVCIVVGFVWREAREVQMQAERAAVQSTLGALRTAYVGDFLQREVRRQAAGNTLAPPELNPFLLLERPQPNYAGETTMGAVAQTPEGSWVFDPTCPCIGYRPLYPRDLLPASDLPVLWFGIAGEVGPRQLQPQAEYLWAGTVVR